MRIGIISNSDQFIPLAHTLANQGLQVCVFYAASEDAYVNQKVDAFISATKLSFKKEQHIATDVYQWLGESRPEVVFVYGYKQLLQVIPFSQAGIPAFNIHHGPLPTFRGPSPVFWQLKKGLANPGLSIHQLSARFDDGPVVWAKTIPDQPHYNYGLVNQLFSHIVIEGVMSVLNTLVRKEDFSPVREPTGMPPAYHKRPVLEDVVINWEQMEAATICNLVRACNPWNKGALTFLDGQELKLMDAVMTGQPTALSPGSISSNGMIATKDKQLINVNMLFLNDTFVPVYHAALYGIAHGKRLGSQ
jgi:methionyl-tRNA formyltransferase